MTRCHKENDMAYETRSTPELRPGDVVFSHGLRLLIDQEINTYPGGGGTPGPVYNTRTLVLNIDEVEEKDAWLAGFVRSDRREDETEVRWTVQGNHLATWGVEVSK